MDDLEQEQLDITDLLDDDTELTTVAVKREEKGDIESMVDMALGTLNEKANKLGAIVLVLQPDELPTNPDTTNPELKVRHSIQVFETPTFNSGESGTGKDVFQICRRIRQLLHRRSFGAGVLSWVGTETVQQLDQSKRSRMVTFERLDHEDSVTRLGKPLIEPEAGGAAPQEVTMTGPAGASIRYTLDGSLPTESAGTLYAGAFTVNTPCTLRAMAFKAGSIPSSVAYATFT